MLYALQRIAFAATSCATFAHEPGALCGKCAHACAGTIHAHEAVADVAEDTGTFASQVAVSCSTFVYLRSRVGPTAGAVLR
jgi:hypothetical protein